MVVDKSVIYYKVLLYYMLWHNEKVPSSAEGKEPSLRLLPKNSSPYNVGENKVIYCKGENIDEELNWYTPDNKLVERATNARVTVGRNKDTDPHLVWVMFQGVKIEDSGNWTCKAGDLEATLNIIVGEQATLKPASESVEALEGSMVTLHCSAKGYPQPTAQWYHDFGTGEDPRILDTTNPNKYVLDKKGNDLTLTIKSLNHNDSGEYICKMTQETLSHYSVKQVILSVIHKPVIQLVHSKEVYAIFNEIKNITCSAKAFPAPEYEWFRRKNNYDDPIKEEGSIFTAEDKSYSVLMLRMYDEDNLGEYKCTAKNQQGSESVIFDVSLGNKPLPPDFVEVIYSSVDELVFNVTCENCTFTSSDTISPMPNEVIGYSFHLVPVREGYPVNWDENQPVLVKIEDPTNTTFVVGNLPNNTKFHARVATCNLAGCSDWLDVQPDPKTTSLAFILSVSPLLILALSLLQLI